VFKEFKEPKAFKGVQVLEPKVCRELKVFKELLVVVELPLNSWQMQLLEQL
jgi:hypothetical protein